MGKLYVVATPIGNLEDLTPRALTTLRKVSLIAAEDTRHTGRLLSHFGITTPQTSYHAFNAKSKESELISLLAHGDIALVTDAGTPGISDPGTHLVDAALAADIRVIAIPGPSSVSAAVSVSGLIEGPFSFLGFLPRTGGERRDLIERALVSGFGIVLFESPYRLQASLDALSEPFFGRRYAVVRELSKIHEEVVRGRFGDHQDGQQFDSARGEIVIVIEGGEPPSTAIDIDTEIDRLLSAGEKPTAIFRNLAEKTGIAKSTLYRRVLEHQRKRIRTGSSSG